MSGQRVALKKVRCSLALIGIAAGSGFLSAQQATAPPPTALESALQRLGEQAVLLQHSLPSLSCMESIISQEFRHKMVASSVDFTASLRAVRGRDGEIRESYEFKTLRGQPFTTGGFVMPIYVTGGFSRALRYFSPDQQPCYHYSMSGGRIDFETAPNLPEACHTRGTSGFALLDEQGKITHLERRVAGRYAEEYHQVPFAALDFAPLTVNGATYVMTRHLFAEQPDGNSTDRFQADYTDCKLFTATVTLGPAVETQDTPATPK